MGSCAPVAEGRECAREADCWPEASAPPRSVETPPKVCSALLPVTRAGTGGQLLDFLWCSLPYRPLQVSEYLLYFIYLILLSHWERPLVLIPVCPLVSTAELFKNTDAWVHSVSSTVGNWLGVSPCITTVPSTSPQGGWGKLALEETGDHLNLQREETKDLT